MLVFLGACKKDNEEIKTSGDLVLSSQILGNESSYYVEGFSFDKAGKVRYNLTSSSIPDLVLENIIDNDGNVTGARLSSPQNDAAFFRAGEFGSSGEAEIFFNSITDAGSHIYSITTDSVKANQVYIFQSRANKYAKLFIKDFAFVPGLLTDYVNVTIQWVYQPNGEKTF